MSIVLDRLSKHYGARAVVDRLSLEILDGELFVLLGASGSGKSTVLRLIAGLSTPDQGAIRLKGRDVTALPPQKRGVGFVFQNYSVFRHMTAAENIEFGLKIRHVPKARRRARRDELLDLVGLGGLGARYPDQLSGGQQQRVALARALAYEPEVLLLDEPFGALDAKIRSQLRRSVRQVQEKLRITTILVTHDQQEAFEMADRIGVIDRGHLVEVGRGEELYRSPRSLFVAMFLGAGTVLVGRSTGGNAEFGSVALPIPPEFPHEEGARVRLLVRPEQMSLESGPPPDGLAFGPGEVVDESFHGSARRVRVRVPSLSQVRQIAPPLPYGEEGFLLDADVSGETAIPERPWVHLKEWRILRRPPPRLLACSPARGTKAPVALARQVASAIRGTAVLLAVAAESEDSDRAAAEPKGSVEEALEVHVRSGNPAEAILQEQSEFFYELLVVSTPRKISRGEPGAQRLLATSATPMLFGRMGRDAFRRILICTAVGEPGKSTVRFGGWLAFRLRAEARLLHVCRPGEGTASPVVRSHLEAGIATLRTLEVPGVPIVRPSHAPLEGILAEADEWDADVVVIGGHGPLSRSITARDDVTLQMLARSERPVVVVPEGSA
jgi:sulfate transport system ATP-binding protein